MVNHERLKQLRQTKGVSLQDMAEALGLQTAGGYHRIESGEVKLSADRLPAIADRLGIPVGDLMTEIMRGGGQGG